MLVQNTFSLRKCYLQMMEKNKGKTMLYIVIFFWKWNVVLDFPSAYLFVPSPPNVQAFSTDNTIRVPHFL